jgi:hypothetical protein
MRHFVEGYDWLVGQLGSELSIMLIAGLVPVAIYVLIGRTQVQ